MNDEQDGTYMVVKVGAEFFGGVGRGCDGRSLESGFSCHHRFRLKFPDSDFGQELLDHLVNEAIVPDKATLVLGRVAALGTLVGVALDEIRGHFSTNIISD